MRFSTFVWLACPTIVVGWSSTSASPTCVTITETTGPICPTLTAACVRPDCIELQTITLECGCPSIYSTTICPTVCPKGCGITYDTVYLPCAASSPSPSPVTTTTTSTSTSTLSTSSNTSILSPPPTSTSSSTSTIYPNSTRTSTSATIITITSCPASVACSGQTTTWTGITGPSSCPSSSTCSGVLPGGTQTVTESTVTTVGRTGPTPTTTPGNTGPTPATSASGSVSVLQSNEGSRSGFGVVEGGVLVGLIGAVLGML